MVYWLFYVKGMTFPLRAGMTMVHGNPWTPGIWQMVISAFLFSAQMPVTALRIKHFRKAGTKNEHALCGLHELQGQAFGYIEKHPK